MHGGELGEPFRESVLAPSVTWAQPWLTLPAPLSAELSHRSYSRLQAYFPSQIYVSRHLLRVDVWITDTQTGKP